MSERKYFLSFPSNRSDSSPLQNITSGYDSIDELVQVVTKALGDHLVDNLDASTLSKCKEGQVIYYRAKTLFTHWNEYIYPTVDKVNCVWCPVYLPTGEVKQSSVELRLQVLEAKYKEIEAKLEAMSQVVSRPTVPIVSSPRAAVDTIRVKNTEEISDDNLSKLQRWCEENKDTKQISWKQSMAQLKLLCTMERYDLEKLLVYADQHSQWPTTANIVGHICKILNLQPSMDGLFYKMAGSAGLLAAMKSYYSCTPCQCRFTSREFHRAVAKSKFD